VHISKRSHYTTLFKTTVEIDMKQDKKTINDFGEQWNYFTSNTGYYGNEDVLIDILGPFYNSNLIQNKLIADIGAGTGRITNLLLTLGAKKVYAIEPSSSFDILKNNTIENVHKIEYINSTGDSIPESIEVDIVLSIGVLHHIPEPHSVIRKAYSILKDNGKIIIWLYGREGNLIYLAVFNLFRKITTQISHKKLLTISKLLIAPLNLYGFLCKYIPLPMKKYMVNHINKLDDDAKLITIYDQLNPCYSKYYTRKEAILLLSKEGFKNVKIYHRHGYSYTVQGEK